MAPESEVVKLRALIVAAVILLAVPASAQQTPVVDIGAGYAFLHDSEVDQDFSVGWLASLNYNSSRTLALTGEVGGSYTSVSSGDDVPVDLDLSLHTLMGGFRFMGRGNDSLAVQPGAGVDLRLGENLSLRLGGDYRWIKGEDGADSGTEYRAHAGIAFGIGRRN